MQIINLKNEIIKHGDWGLGIGDWGLGVWPNPPTPIPNPPSPIPLNSKKFFKMIIYIFLNFL